MQETIFLLDNDGKLLTMQEAAYDSEYLLQKLLADYPHLISVSQIDKDYPRMWVLVSREFGVWDDENAGNRWSLDHLFLDQDGIPTLVEVKRSTDTRICREVIGQILDYAANAVSYWQISDIIHLFEEQCHSEGVDPEEKIYDLLQTNEDVDVYWEKVQTNLKAGKIRMLLIADMIPKEMQKIMEFLNEQMSPAEILGLEIKQYQGEKLKTLVPRVIGKTAQAQSAKSISRPNTEQWDEEKFFKTFTEASKNDAEIARRVIDWFETEGAEMWYGSGQTGSCVPIITVNQNRHQLCAIRTNRQVELYFYHYQNKKPFDQEERRYKFLEKINLIEGVNIPFHKIAGKPKIPIAYLATEDAFKKFTEAFEWFFEAARCR